MPKKMRLKERAVVGFLFLFIIPEQACGTIQPQWYAGLNLALSHFAINQRYQASDTLLRNLIANVSPNVSQNIMGIGVSGGYAIRKNNLWLAGELSYMLDRLDAEQKMRFSMGDGVFKCQSTGAWQGLIHIGYIPHSFWAVYAISGIELRHFHVNCYDSLTNMAPEINKKYMSLAFVPGIGVRVYLTKNIAFRGEYKVALHSPKNMTESAYGPRLNQVKRSMFKQSPRIHTLQLGFIYSFSL